MTIMIYTRLAYARLLTSPKLFKSDQQTQSKHRCNMGNSTTGQKYYNC